MPATQPSSAAHFSAEPDVVPGPGGGLHVTYPEPHLERTRTLLANHPEVKALFGPSRLSALLVVGLVALQVGLAFALKDSPFWLIFLVAYGVGAFVNHALWVLIHECTHNLVLGSSAANAWLQIFANFPILFPSAISFRKFHLLHHRFQGDPELDADLASPFEARLVGKAWWRKALWLSFFWAFQAARVPRLKRIPFFDRWYAANLAGQAAFIAAMWALAGPWALVYLLISSVFAIGLHPVGARWIQEHYIVKPGQETYSYYGPLNVVALNVGYHNEHHDLMRVCWFRLPKVKAIAPELYDGLHAHRSWTRLLFRFLFDPSLTLLSRVTRSTRPAAAEPRVESRRPPEPESEGMPAAMDPQQRFV